MGILRLEMPLSLVSGITPKVSFDSMQHGKGEIRRTCNNRYGTLANIWNSNVRMFGNMDFLNMFNKSIALTVDFFCFKYSCLIYF